MNKPMSPGSWAMNKPEAVEITYVLQVAVMAWQVSPVQNSEMVLYCRLIRLKNVVAATKNKREKEVLTRGINHRGQSNTWANERGRLVTVMSRSSVNDEDTPIALHTIHLSVTLISGAIVTCPSGQHIVQQRASETKHRNGRLLQLWESCCSSRWRLKQVFLPVKQSIGQMRGSVTGEKCFHSVKNVFVWDADSWDLPGVLTLLLR